MVDMTNHRILPAIPLEFIIRTPNGSEWLIGSADLPIEGHIDTEPHLAVAEHMTVDIELKITEPLRMFIARHLRAMAHALDPETISNRAQAGS